jgi:hypothetical protein
MSLDCAVGVYCAVNAPIHAPGLPNPVRFTGKVKKIKKILKFPVISTGI